MVLEFPYIQIDNGCEKETLTATKQVTFECLYSLVMRLLKVELMYEGLKSENHM